VAKGLAGLAQKRWPAAGQNQDNIEKILDDTIFGYYPLPG